MATNVERICRISRGAECFRHWVMLELVADEP